MASYDAVSLDDVKAVLGIEGTDEDAKLTLLISTVTLELERRLGTQFVQRSLTEQHEGACRRMYLGRTPIVSVTSIVDPAGNTIPSTDYLVRQSRWLEHYGNFWFAWSTSGQRADWTVTYTAGHFASTSVVAPDVRMEVVRAISSLREAPNSGVSSVGVGDLSLSYATGDPVTSAAVDAAVAALHHYRGVYL